MRGGEVGAVMISEGGKAWEIRGNYGRGSTGSERKGDLGNYVKVGEVKV